MNTRFLELFLISFLFGVAGYFIGAWFFIVSTIVGFCVAMIVQVKARKKCEAFFPRLFGLLAVVIIGLSIGYFWTFYFVSSHASELSESLFNKKEMVVGIISDDPNRGIEGTTIVIEPKFIDGNAVDAPNDHIQLSLPAGTDANYGDEISFSGTIKHPESFTTDTGREFDYPTYLLVHGITATSRVKSIEIISHHHKSRFIESLFGIKKYFVSTIKKLFPSPESGLFAGIVIGEKSLLPKYNLQEFQIAGLTHMIVLSGYNITIVSLFAMTLLAWLGLGYRARRVGAIIAIPIFIVMTGMGASSVRAGIMAIIVFLLQLDTRPPNSLRVILITLCAMVFVNPYSLLYDPSLHLSFMAFIGLVYVTPITQFLFLEKWMIAEWGGMRDLLIETMSVQVFVLPYIIWMSGRVSILTLLSNLITVPLTPIVMAVGFGVTIIGMIVHPIGMILAKPVSWVMTYMLSVAHIVASMHFATFMIPPFGGRVMAGIYAVFVVGIGFGLRKILQE